VVNICGVTSQKTFNLEEHHCENLKSRHPTFFSQFFSVVRKYSEEIVVLHRGLAVYEEPHSSVAVGWPELHLRDTAKEFKDSLLLDVAWCSNFL